ncbi:MAG: recombinase family protein [Lachnospiraceae bacterium]|nr:recombinase family protein [Lachnospiraceae bacterium]
MKLPLVESRLFGRICYGYRRNKQGLVEIVPEEAEVVKTVFGLYRDGSSLEGIQNYLFSQGIQKWGLNYINH